MKKMIEDFKKFIAKGNAFDMAVGVIIGGAFNKIVTSLTSILMSVCTWGVPGGINGLITVLPAANDTQKGMMIAGEYVQSFNINDIQEIAENLALTNYTEAEVNANLELIESAKTTLLSNYTLHGTTYTYNMCSVIDWGSFINAIISFIIIAITLFVIVKIASNVRFLRNKAKEKAMVEIEKAKKELEDNKKEFEEKLDLLKDKFKDKDIIDLFKKEQDTNSKEEDSLDTDNKEAIEDNKE